MTQAEKQLIVRFLKIEHDSHRRSIENAEANSSIEEEKLSKILAWNNARINEILAINTIIKYIPITKDEEDPFA